MNKHSIVGKTFLFVTAIAITACSVEGQSQNQESTSLSIEKQSTAYTENEATSDQTFEINAKSKLINSAVRTVRTGSGVDKVMVFDAGKRPAFLCVYSR